MSNSNKKPGFTLMELMLVLCILGLLASFIAPNLQWTDSQLRLMQRCLQELSGYAGEGGSLRLRAEHESGGRGRLIPEIMVTADGEQEWKELDIANPIRGDQWEITPQIIQFFPDGTVSPAKITWHDELNQSRYLLTVTGYLLETAAR